MASYITYLVLVIGTVATLALTLAAEWSANSAGMIVVLVGSLVYLAIKIEGTRTQLGELGRLRAAYDQLDQQSKLIIRTDLELHRTQEELDQRVTSLTALHQLGRRLQVNLRPEEVFRQVDQATVTSFGFANGLVGMCESLEAVRWCSLISVNPPAANALREHLVTSGLLNRILTGSGPLTLHTASVREPAERTLLELLQVSSAVVAGIKPHDGPAGCLLLGREGSAATPDAKSDEELVSILTRQLAVAVENSALYEKAWTAQQDLERKVRERTHELAQANAALIQLNKAKSDFVSAVSHELRTPMAAIKGYASLLGSGQFGKLAPPQHERIGKIEKHVDLLTQLINNLLDIARIESGGVTMERQPIPMHDLLTSIHDLVQPQLEAKRLRYVVDRDGVTELVGDHPHLQRVFINLLSNAIKYTPDEGTIRLGFTREGTSILASVSDTGCGISPEELPKLFQEFYRANDPVNQQIRGTGLGLALVKRIVEAHQGRIWVTSEKGKGSTFSVSLPAEQAGLPTV